MCGSKELVGIEKYSGSVSSDQFAVADTFVGDLELEDYIVSCLKLVNDGAYDIEVKAVVVESVYNRESMDKVARRKKLNKVQLATLPSIKQIFESQLKFA